MSAVLALAVGGAAPPAAGGAPGPTVTARSGMSGDFDGDGYDDLVVGAAYEDVGAVRDAGNVTIAYGGPAGVGPGGRTGVVRQGLAGVPGTPEANDRFGVAVATGDFDGDGYDDLAAGADFEDLGRMADAGNVTVVHGSALGLTGARSVVLRQDGAPGGGTAEAGDRFGAALAAGDVDGDGYDDLAVGAPFEDIGEAGWAGNVTLLFGGPAGLGGSALTVRQGLNGLPGTPGGFETFGRTVAIADMDADGWADLAVGAPLEASGSVFAGTVTVVPGAPGGVAERKARTLRPTELLCGCAVDDMQFGDSLAAGDLNADGHADLVVGAPGWSTDAGWGVGNVHVVFGTADRAYPVLTFDQSTFGLAMEADDRFGEAVAIGPVAAGGPDDLLVGAPSEAIDDVDGAGLVVLVRGAGAEFPGPSTVFHQDDLVGAVEEWDIFGRTLAVGDFSGDGEGDAVFGAPFEDVGAVVDAGNVIVLDTTGGAVAFDQGDLGGTLEAEDFFGYTG